MMKRRLDTHLALVFGVTVTLALVGIIYFVNNRAAAILEGATSTMFAQMTNQSRASIDDSFSNLNLMTAMFAADPQVQSRTPENEQALVRQFSLIMKAKPFTSAMYVGYDDGGFILLRQLSSPVARRNLSAPDTASYLLQTIRNTAQGRETRLVFLDAALDPVGELDRPDFFYDPRNRRWYYDAFASDGAILTDPYRFFATAESGVTIARRIASNRGVMAIDLSLADLSQALRRMKNTPSSELIITDPNGAVIAASNPAAELPTAFQNSPSRGRVTDVASTVVPTMLTAVRDHSGGDKTSVISDNGRAWTMHVAPLHSGQWTFAMAVAMPQDEIMAGVRQIVTTLGWISLGLILVVILAIRYTATAVSRPLVAIAEEAAAIQSFNFQDLPGNTRSSVTEIDTLSRAIQNARLTIRRFIEIGRALSAERDPDRLTRRLLQETISITSSEAGFIFLSEDNGATFLMLGDRSERLAPADDEGSDEPAAEELGLLTDAASGTAARLIHALRRRDVTHFDIADPAHDDMLAPLTRSRPLAAGQVLRCSVIPLLNRADEVIGGLLLCSPAREDAPIPYESLDLARALSGNAAVAIETTLLLKSRKKLLDAVIRMIALATDAKSPYTNGHCQRVPLITHALAQAACDSREGPYADFNLTPEEWEAVDVASWLHDCGKLTTAEYVIDKATKLETITDRIHEIRMRFELLKAQAETAYWQALAKGGDEAQLRAVRDGEWHELDEDFAFVASCNEGGEFMEPHKIERLYQIARRRWTRTLSDRIGISSEERRRRERVAEPSLPVTEPLLADRPDHIVDHFSNQLDDFEAKAGFSLKRPDHRLNLGELHNLSIGRGTLTEEERYEINRHITRTILMLEGLPLAGPLANVPEYAGGHHEKMDGTGYPRGLVRDELSPVARMMAIADVFEALTAGDRPYKKAKTLSEAIRIMGFMKRDGHLDPDLLDLFLRSGIWRDYAREHLSPGQIDEPDVDAVLAMHPVQRAA
ncbi:GAF domain-containing protein [Ancylobacter sp. A5.8]|uniref:HD domain-containing phosphohydrolase n=1 Tax=Ancylobacter gelatini TaxID=2919920 RepID=UPI001F4E9086|nr:HD domain-containing phosphohydrolase [Ancylobacter gelatini]MCJ8144351.1 GAF domain-containing protein [Ancylobacter gelatini]